MSRPQTIKDKPKIPSDYEDYTPEQKQQKAIKDITGGHVDKSFFQW